MQAIDERIPEQLAEALEAMWVLEERNELSLENLERHGTDRISPGLLESLRDKEYIALGKEGPRFLPRGRKAAEKIIRQHRLAERLVCDVLGSHVDESEAAACEFEHLIAEGITSSICTLLGHPRYCPHNRPIPEGDCCKAAGGELKSIVTSCDQLGVGQSGRIAYVATREHSRLLRLSALGITPGIVLKVLQKRPSYVVQCDETEIALEAEVARCIYVWQD
jgi:DtxR family transcriptional regulator, Mn-dependent transcriptional regulator